VTAFDSVTIFEFDCRGWMLALQSDSHQLLNKPSENQVKSHYCIREEWLFDLILFRVYFPITLNNFP
jgi:hypothetical protein